MNETQKIFPKLFEEFVSAEGDLRMQFMQGDEFPADLIGTVKMAGYRGDEYLAIRGPSGWWEPGGKPEPGETYLEAIEREMLEETGCRVVDFRLFGAFHCISLEDTPPRPGLLWPEFYFLWGYGEVRPVARPLPTNEENILEIGFAPLDETCARLGQNQEAGSVLVDIYRLVDLLRREGER